MGVQESEEGQAVPFQWVRSTLLLPGNCGSELRQNANTTLISLLCPSHKSLFFSKLVRIAKDYNEFSTQLVRTFHSCGPIYVSGPMSKWTSVGLEPCSTSSAFWPSYTDTLPSLPSQATSTCQASLARESLLCRCQAEFSSSCPIMPGFQPFAN